MLLFLALITFKSAFPLSELCGALSTSRRVYLYLKLTIVSLHNWYGIGMKL